MTLNVEIVTTKVVEANSIYKFVAFDFKLFSLKYLV